MAKRPERFRLSALVLALAFHAGAGGAAGQADPPGPVVLDSSAASGLMLNQAKPEYPPVARVNYIQGHVRLQLAVTRDGRVGEAHVLGGHPILAASALKAVRRWLYRPFLTASGAAPFLTTVDVNFTLHTKKIEQFPDKAERDLNRQIQPPALLERPIDSGSMASVRLRVLVSAEGHVIDSHPVTGPPSHFAAARKAVERWAFRPARWGALPVPWYLDIDVPIEKVVPN